MRVRLRAARPGSNQRYSLAALLRHRGGGRRQNVAQTHLISKKLVLAFKYVLCTPYGLPLTTV